MTTTAPDDWSNAPDSEWAAEWARIALQHGRIELGYQISKIAVQAYRHEQNSTQLPDTTPAAAGPDVSQPIYLPVFAGAASARAESLADNENAVPIIVPPDLVAPTIAAATAQVPAPPTVVPNGRCSRRTPGGLECHGVAFYDPERQAWVHMDSDLDQLHEPVVPPTAFNGTAEADRAAAQS